MKCRFGIDEEMKAEVKRLAADLVEGRLVLGAAMISRGAATGEFQVTTLVVQVIESKPPAEASKP